MTAAELEAVAFYADDLARSISGLAMRPGDRIGTPAVQLALRALDSAHAAAGLLRHAALEVPDRG